jgi:hypothetical protein
MARIRSIHPGFFSDDIYAFLSDSAQAFVIGLWTECDDQGIFEWNPGKLKLRLRPGKDGSVDPILEELEAANCIKSYELDGRKYGLVRNFKDFQRPKKPNSTYFMPPEFRTYTSSRHQSSELDKVEAPSVPNSTQLNDTQFRTSGEMLNQRERNRRGIGEGEEDGGDKGTGKGKGKDAREPRSPGPDPDPILSSGKDVLEETLREAAGWQTNKSRKLAITGPIQELLDRGVSLEYDVLPVVRMCATTCKTPSWMYFLPAILEAYANRLKAATGPPPTTGAMSHEEAERIRKREEARRIIEEHNAKAIANGQQPSP